MSAAQDVRTDVSPTVEELVAAALEQLGQVDYARETQTSLGSVWRRLARFARQAEESEFSTGLIERFLADRGFPPDGRVDPMPSILRRYLRALRKLVEFQRQGRIEPRRRVDRQGSLSPHFRQVLAEYEERRRQAGMRPTTLRMCHQNLPTLLLFLQQAGVEHLSQVRPAHMSDFLLSLQHHATGTISAIMSVARCFLRYLQQQGVLQDDVVATMPRMRRCRQAKIPTVWTPEQVDGLLAAVDRGSPQGKRDYAILLLAARLGMRVGDIVRLRLEDIHWEARCIELSQAKTGQPLALPLSEEVGWALIDYLRHARPSVAHREVFLWCKPPFCPFVHRDNLQHLIHKYRRRAGISVPREQPSGLHTLRHSLASHLLSLGTPLPTISEVLGHTNSESTLIYTKVDLPRLQTCALDPEELSDARA
jgi:site-specific recombinase XerD